MILTVLIFNSAGKPRLSKFYSANSPNNRITLLNKLFNLVSTRPDNVCNFVELAGDGDDNLKVIYRHYATLYFVFLVDQSESELAILDLIQVFVESLDRCFENVCELDLIFHFDQVHALLGCIITGGLVLDTSIDSIASTFSAQSKATKSSQASSTIGGIITLKGIQSGLSDVGLDRFGLGLIGNGFKR